MAKSKSYIVIALYALEVVAVLAGLAALAFISGDHLKVMGSISGFQLGYLYAGIIGACLVASSILFAHARNITSIAFLIASVAISGYTAYEAINDNFTHAKQATVSTVIIDKELSQLVDEKKAQAHLVKQWDKKLLSGRKQSTDTKVALSKARFQLSAITTRIDKLKKEKQQAQPKETFHNGFIYAVLTELYFLLIAVFFKTMREILTINRPDEGNKTDAEIERLLVEVERLGGLVAHLFGRGGIDTGRGGIDEMVEVVIPTTTSTKATSNTININDLNYTNLYQVIPSDVDYLTATELIKYVQMVGVEKPSSVQIGKMMRGFGMKPERRKGYKITKPTPDLKLISASQ